MRTIPKDVLTLLDGGNIFTMDTEVLEAAVEKISIGYKMGFEIAGEVP